MSVLNRLRSLPPRLQNALLSAVTVLVFGGGLEGLCRFLEPRTAVPPVASYITDWALWEGDFYTVKSTAVGWPPFEDYNSDGLRDREHALEKPAGVRRLICLGDSTTAGFRIRPEEAYPQVLQDRLDALGRRVEVFNVALGGWSTHQELIAYRRIARHYKPDHVLVGVCLNDIPEIANNLTRPPGWLAGLSRHSALVRRLARAGTREIRSVEELITDSASPKVKEAYRRFFGEVRTLRDEVRADGATFGLVVFPFGLQIAADAPPPRPQETIAAFCRAERISCLDLLPALREAGDESFVDYDHFSPTGSEVVADEILASSLIPDEGMPSLSSPDEGTRLQKARDLGQREGESQESVPHLAALLADESPAVRAASVWALGRLGARPEAITRAVVKALGDPDAQVRAGAAWALGRLGPEARLSGPALAARLGDEDVEVRRRAAAALARVKADPATCVAPALHVLENEHSPGRAEAARVLALFGPAAQAAVEPLERALRSESPELRREALSALGAIGPPARAAVPALLAVFEDPALRWRVPDALGAIGPDAREAVPALTASLADKNATVRWRAAKALGRIGPGAGTAAPALAQLLRDPQDNVRLGAIGALAHVQAPPEFCGPIFGHALSDPNSEVRKKAADALAEMGPRARAAVPDLLGDLRDEDRWVRISVVRALARVGSRTPAVNRALQQAERDEDEAVRAEAARALSRHKAS